MVISPISISGGEVGGGDWDGDQHGLDHIGHGLGK
jgi:hypothetical protein